MARASSSQAALAAYTHKLRTGRGQFVQVPMFEAFSQFLLLEHLAGLTFDPPNALACYFRQIDPDRQPLPTRDGSISIVPYALDSWDRVFEVLGDATFLDAPDFADSTLRFRNQGILYRRAGELTPAKSSAEWTELFSAARVSIFLAMPGIDRRPAGSPSHCIAMGVPDEHVHDLDWAGKP